MSLIGSWDSSDHRMHIAQPKKKKRMYMNSKTFLMILGETNVGLLKKAGVPNYSSLVLNRGIREYNLKGCYVFLGILEVVHQVPVKNTLDSGDLLW